MIKSLIGAIVATTVIVTVIALAAYAGLQYMGLHNEVEKAVEAPVATQEQAK